MSEKIPAEWLVAITPAAQKAELTGCREAFVSQFWHLKNTEIAWAVGVSEWTIRQIRKRIIKKNKDAADAGQQ